MSNQSDDRPLLLYENRYCDQNEFDTIIFVLGRYDINTGKTSCVDIRSRSN